MTGMISTARRRELGAELRRLRERLGIKGQDLAARLEWTPTMVSRVETGKRVVTQFEVLKYTMACGADAMTQATLMELAIEPDDYRLKPHGKVPDELKALIYHESTASAIDIYEPIYIPGITQTEDYMRALFDETGILLNPAEIDDRIEIRLCRRSVLTRTSPAQCALFVHENALRAPVGGPWVMHEQMLHLLFASSRPQCSIRVVPTSSAGRGMAPGSFHVFTYPEGEPLVYLQHETTSEFLEDPKELHAYRTVLQRVASVALPDAQSREFIAWMASEYEQQGAARHGSGPGVAKEHL